MYPFDIVEDSLKYIEDHLDSDLSVESIASTLGFSNYYYHRLFTAVMGISLNNYVLKRKLNAALSQIKHTDTSLTDIAMAYDFSTPSSFTRAFKREYNITPSEFRKNPTTLNELPIPTIIERPLKNFNGDIVSDFTISDIDPFKVSGFVFRFDLALDDFHETIAKYAQKLLTNLDDNFDSPCYIIYSDCLPNSTVFNVIVGIPQVVTIDQPLFLTVDVPNLFVSEFNYSGQLIEMEEVLNSDYARFLKIARQEADPSHINMIQRFNSIHDLNTSYKLFVPIKKITTDK